MPIREATFIPRIANHSKVHQTWFSRQPNRILPNTELWRKARGTKMGNAIPLRVVVSSLAREITRQRKREMRRTAMEDEPIAGSHTHSLFPPSLSRFVTMSFLKNEELQVLFLKNEEWGEEASRWPWRIFTGNIYMLWADPDRIRVALTHCYRKYILYTCFGRIGSTSFGRAPTGPIYLNRPLMILCNYARNCETLHPIWCIFSSWNWGVC